MSHDLASLEFYLPVARNFVGIDLLVGCLVKSAFLYPLFLDAIENFDFCVLWNAMNMLQVSRRSYVCWRCALSKSKIGLAGARPTGHLVANSKFGVSLSKRVRH